jgi:hypothetical protein
MQGRFRVRL